MATSIKQAFIAMVLLAAVSSPVAVAQTIAGVATAKDGDSLVVDGQEVRLFGIDAPEFDQTCQRNGEPWECGQAAKAQLSALVKGVKVWCQRISTDAYGRAVSKCYAGSDELNRTMVEQGWAIAYREFSLDYEREESLAHRNGLGIWSGEFQQPSDFRHLKEPPTKVTTRQAPRTRAAPKASISGCVIKGNRNRRGEWIYHLPGMPYYDVTRPEEIFCSEAAAQAAGYRRAIVKQ